MAKIVLFHSVLGVTPGVEAAAARLEAAGHTVYVPNLYDKGKVFRDYKHAQAYADTLGIARLLNRTQRLVAKLPARVVYAGFSNGGASAEYLALTRAGAQGLIMFHAALPLPLLARVAGEPLRRWPGGVSVQVHYSIDDPFRNQAWIDQFEASVGASGAVYSFCEYPGSGHQFSDTSLTAEYDAAAAETMWSRTLNFLSDIDTAQKPS